MPRVPEICGWRAMSRGAVEQIWAGVSERMRRDIGDTAWRSWIKPLTPAKIKQDILVLHVDSRLVRDRALSQYSDRLRLHVRIESPDIQDVSIQIGSETQDMSAITQAETGTVRIQPSAASPSSADLAVKDAPRLTKMAAGQVSDQDTIGLNPAFCFENFVIGKPNELAFAAAQRVAESANSAFNPLFLYGGVGLGKTHLMHAIAWQVRANHPDRKVMYLTAEKFMHQFIRALKDRDTMAFKERFRSADVLMVDDVQFFADRESTQEEFFHTFNALVDEGRQVVLSADKSPHDLSGIGERLRSRMGCGMVADIHPANFELRYAILQARNELCGGAMPDKVLEFLAHKITSNIRELEGAFTRIIAHADLIGKEITVDMARDTLSDLLRASARRVTVEDIQKQVCTHFAIRMQDMHSARRARNIARPRQIAMFLAKNLTHSSYPEIGRKFGNRDHTTIMHAVKKVEDLMRDDNALADDVALLRSILADG